MRLDDLDTGKVSRCSDGTPSIVAAYRGAPGSFVGGCSADAGATADGMLIAMPDVSVALPVFTMYTAPLAI